MGCEIFSRLIYLSRKSNIRIKNNFNFYHQILFMAGLQLQLPFTFQFLISQHFFLTDAITGNGNSECIIPTVFIADITNLRDKIHYLYYLS